MEPQITPVRCGELAGRLSGAVTLLGQAGIQLHEASRLPLGIRLLQDVAKGETFPQDPHRRAAISEAIRDSAEWPLIASAFDEILLGEVGEDVRSALGGALGMRTGRALQHQAQLFFGAILAQDGKPIAAPVKKGLPDFTIPDGTLIHGVEVKAPETRKGLQEAITKGIRQLKRVTGGGMLALDLSALIEAEIGAVPPSSYEDLELRMGHLFDELSGSVAGRIPRPGPWKPHEGVIVTAVIARVHQWIPSTGGPRPASVFATAAQRHFRTYGSLTYHRATMLRDRIESGLQATTGEDDLVWRPHRAS